MVCYIPAQYVVFQNWKSNLAAIYLEGRMKHAHHVDFNLAYPMMILDLPTNNGARSGLMVEWYGIRGELSRLLTGTQPISSGMW